MIKRACGPYSLLIVMGEFTKVLYSYIMNLEVCVFSVVIVVLASSPGTQLCKLQILH